MKRILGLCSIIGFLIPLMGISGNSIVTTYQKSYPTGQVVVIESENSILDSQITKIENIKIEIDTTQIFSTIDGHELAYFDLSSAPFEITADRLEVSIDTIQNSDIQIIKVRVDQSLDNETGHSDSYIPPVGFSDSIF